MYIDAFVLAESAIPDIAHVYVAEILKPKIKQPITEDD